jgi:hypothetical protein
VAGGISSVLGGGKFGHGFWSAGLTKGLDVNSLIPGVGDGLNAARAIVAALVGGTISELTGGKFANGAVTAGLAQAVNGNSFWDDAEMLAEMAADFMPGAALLDCVSGGCSYTEWALASAEVAAVVIPGGVAVKVAFKAFQKWKAASQVGKTADNLAGYAHNYQRSVGASQRVPKVLQTGGNKLSSRVSDELNDYFGENLTKRDWGRALEGLKKDNGLRNDHHGRILDNGDYVNDAGDLIGNIADYLP